MLLSNTLDAAIREWETKKNPGIRGGYTSPAGKPYNNYLANDIWEVFLNNMISQHPSAYRSFLAGGGGELMETKSPPKMASFGSSSRMLYQLAKDIKGFRFEKKLCTTVGGMAHLDGFRLSEQVVHFVEAKCREPYNNRQSAITFRTSLNYLSYFQFLSESCATPFICKMEVINPKSMRVSFAYNNHPVSKADIKQILSHLLGIATADLGDSLLSKRISFLYLLFNPLHLHIEDDSARQRIATIYKEVYSALNHIDFSGLYYDTLLYLQENWGLGQHKDIASMSERFSFTLCDQNSFAQCLLDHL